jgi:hypothetical protein
MELSLLQPPCVYTEYPVFLVGEALSVHSGSYGKLKLCVDTTQRHRQATLVKYFYILVQGYMVRVGIHCAV